MELLTLGYLLIFSILTAMLIMLVTTNHWTRGKLVVTLFVAMTASNYGLLTISAYKGFMRELGLYFNAGLMAQALVFLLAIIYLLRSGIR